MKRSFAITGFAVLMLCVFSSSSLANQKKPRTLVAGIFDKLMNKDGARDTALPAKECQGAINQFFSSLLPPPYATVAQNGFIVDRSNKENLYQVVDRLVVDDKLRKQIGHNGASVLDTYAEAKIIDCWKQLIAAVL